MLVPWLNSATKRQDLSSITFTVRFAGTSAEPFTARFALLLASFGLRKIRHFLPLLYRRLVFCAFLLAARGTKLFFAHDDVLFLLTRFQTAVIQLKIDFLKSENWKSNYFCLSAKNSLIEECFDGPDYSGLVRFISDFFAANKKCRCIRIWRLEKAPNRRSISSKGEILFKSIWT